MPRASLVITTKNRPHLLPRAVESAKASAADVEVVVVDDASDDETAEVCSKLKDITYVRIDRNQCVAGARNVGLISSTGKYIGFLDDDDLRLPDSLDEQISLLEAEPRAGLVYGQAVVASNDGELTADKYPQQLPDGDVFWNLMQRNFMPCGAVVFRRACLETVGLLDDAIAGIDDWDLWVRIAELYPVIALPHPVMIWRRSTPSSGQGTSAAADIVQLSTKQFSSWLRLGRAVQESREMKRIVTKEFSKNMAAHLLFDTGRALTSGRLELAVKDLAFVTRYHSIGVGHLVFQRALSALR